jgi:hypothetical protein
VAELTCVPRDALPLGSENNCFWAPIPPETTPDDGQICSPNTGNPCPIVRAVSMGRHNTSSQSICRSLKS